MNTTLSLAASGPISSRSCVRSNNVVGHTSGQWVKPKKIADGLPFRLSLESRLPFWSVSSNGPPIGTRAAPVGPLGRTYNSVPSSARAATRKTLSGSRRDRLRIIACFLAGSMMLMGAGRGGVAGHRTNLVLDLDRTRLFEHQGAPEDLPLLQSLAQVQKHQVVAARLQFDGRARCDLKPAGELFHAHDIVDERHLVDLDFCRERE